MLLSSSKPLTLHTCQAAGNIRGYSMAMEPHEEPVENAMREAMMNVKAGMITGLSPPDSMESVMKSAVCKSLVTKASAHANISIMIAANIVLNPFII